MEKIQQKAGAFAVQSILQLEWKYSSKVTGFSIISANLTFVELRQEAAAARRAQFLSHSLSQQKLATSGTTIYNLHVIQYQSWSKHNPNNEAKSSHSLYQAFKEFHDSSIRVERGRHGWRAQPSIVFHHYWWIHNQKVIWLLHLFVNLEITF